MAIIALAKKQKQTVSLTSEIEDKVNALDTQSGRIRFLASLGYSTGQIASALDIRYQWVRNVLITPLKKK